MSTREQLLQIADELRAHANIGLYFAKREDRVYDYERFEHILHLSAKLLSLADSRDSDEILRLYSGNLDYTCPKVGAEAALFDANGRMFLSRRSDNGKWCMPGGGLEPGETAAEGAVREMREECGLVVLPQTLIAVFDNRRINRQPPSPVHAYHFLFECEYVSGSPTPSNETSEFGYFTEDELPPLHPGQVLKIEIAFRRHAGLLPDTYFDS